MEYYTYKTSTEIGCFGECVIEAKFWHEYVLDDESRVSIDFVRADLDTVVVQLSIDALDNLMREIDLLEECREYGDDQYARAQQDYKYNRGE